MGTKFWIGMALAACAGWAIAGGRGEEARKQTEASMLVTGTVDIETDGRVSGFRLDEAEKLPGGATQLIDKAAPTWKFEPVVVDGKVVRARTRMSLRIVAHRQDEERFEVRIASANFGEAGNPGEYVTRKQLAPPKYPESAAMSGVKGTVYLVVKVGRDGSVEDVIAEQVNLKVVDNPAGMTRWRRELAKAAINGARGWTFNPPTVGDEVGEPFWRVRVPVDFMLHDEKPTPYGQWEAYIPGPRQSAPWRGDLDTSLGADAVAGGGIYPVGAGPKLLTPLGGT